LRLENHLKEYYGKAYTAGVKDWEIFLQIDCSTISLALKIEKHIKNMKSRKYINDLKKYPEIITRLKEKYIITEYLQ
jgi:putative endonuclease